VGTVAAMGLSVISIDHLLLCRYAEATPDGLMNVVGGGLARIARTPPGGVSRLSVAAAVDVEHAAGDAMLHCRLINPAGETHVELEIMVAGFGPEEAIHRIPLCFDLTGELAVAGTWRVELTGGVDMRAVNFFVE
jgi:hypothetical protein